ncbi:hypothetical protein [Methylobacterium platani]|uniref:hypothetical protein n=1 Tax=Methylobacterium platani TaxID=427683 RepID=UPI000B2581D4|nr:hypothetical protein [Methylobacterium platani]
MSISAGNPKTPTLDDLASDALDLRNATVVTRIVLDHCLAMTRRDEGATYKTFNLLPQQLEAMTYSMLRLEAMSEALADAIESYQTAGAQS